jgi:hypothetical protein
MKQTEDEIKLGTDGRINETGAEKKRLRIKCRKN